MGRSVCAAPGQSWVPTSGWTTPSRATSSACTSRAPASLAPPGTIQGSQGGMRGGMPLVQRVGGKGEVGKGVHSGEREGGVGGQKEGAI